MESIDIMSFPSSSTVNLQQTIAASTSDAGQEAIVPHHPITCASELHFYEDGSFGCEHITVPPNDGRTKQALTHSIAILILEEAVRKFKD